MAKRQNWTRDLGDVLANPFDDDYLTYDGAMATRSNFWQAFYRAAKPQYMWAIVGAFLDFFVTGGSFIAIDLLFLAFISYRDKTTEFGGMAGLENIYFNTTGKDKGGLDIKKLSRLKELKNYGLLSMGLAPPVLGAGYLIIGFVPSMSFVLGWTALYFSQYWRSKQVLDGNWSVTDQQPPDKKIAWKTSGQAVPDPV